MVVDADVGASRAGRHIGRVGHHGDAAVDQPVDRLGDLGFVLGLEDHAVAAAQPGQRVDHLCGRTGLPQVESRPQHGRREGGQFGLDGRAERVGEPLRGLHDDVDQVAPAVEPQLGALFVQVGDRLHDLGAGVLPHAGPLVQHPVDGGLAQPGLLGDLADLVAVRHVRAFLRCF